MFAVLSSARKAPGRIAILLAALWLSACQPVATTGGGGQPINPSQPVAVALLLPHGSAVPQEQRLARDLENAARMAASDMSGVQIDLRVYGTAGQAAQARTAALNAVTDGASIIIGPLHAESANAVAVAVADRGINVLTFSNNSTIAGGNLFVLGQTFDNTANRLVGYATRSGKSRIMAVYSDNLAGQLGRQAIEQAAARNGATIAGSIGYTFSQQGVVSAVPRIRDAARENNADAIFLTANTAGALPLFSQMLPEAGLSTDTIQYMGLSRWDTPPQTLELPGVQGGWFALPDPQRSAQFKSRFQAAYGSAPHDLAGLAYDGIAAVGALAKSGDRNALSRGSLTQSAGFQGVNGVFRLRPDGTNERGLAVATIRDQQVVVIDPAPRGFGGAGF
ncbi:amino acid/amide ABC transporter substrate-binding protein (HAAT family) [Roseovarius halotolerans]|uniref:Receptor family ligand binding region n=1 Tax=Roseovarius halotolerans TaxID=505353 RepID=A0A1X6YWM2_9RHOB|nr:penicillin-binding protein activator [Roseovarius halotolerans]RKT32710.1 amino acid/amide ABC transporter substrate-binding protein (HAAT family) [Roseovarius halotolerans]SLN33843.1 Receptor family ligand binding region [Roseovarius halotolerans]